MNYSKRVKIEGGIAALLACILLGMLVGHAFGQEHPAFGPQQVIQLTVTADVPDIAKLEAKAVEILRRPGTVTGEVMTLAQARAYVRVNSEGKPDPKGRTDVARCLEIVIPDRLRGITQARVTATVQAALHPGEAITLN